MHALADDQTIAQRVLDHIDGRTTDLSEATWREPVEHYRSADRLGAELALVFRRTPTPFCPSVALPEAGSYLARDAAGTPILAVRGSNGAVRAFRNACRHRGTQVASGAGCAKAFVCRYHGWTYGLDGALRHVPHAHGFPDLDPAAHGLVPVEAVERDGLVYVTQERAAASEPIAALPEVIGPQHRLVATTEGDLPANWKVLADGFLEGYHIRPTHQDTFYPVQFDNLNVIETFGRNSRITFPYRNVNKLRAVPPAERSVAGVLTFVYHLFPNVMLATFPTNVTMVVLEPLAVDRTRMINFTMVAGAAQAADGGGDLAQAGAFLEAGAAEDREVACSIQRGLASGANEYFEFGRFEGALRHFHRNLAAAIEAAR